jgi:hypothetical protein
MQAVKAYFAFVSRLVNQDDLDLARIPHSNCDVDFVAYVVRDKVADVETRIAEFSHDLQRRSGVHFSTLVLPKEEESP